MLFFFLYATIHITTCSDMCYIGPQFSRSVQFSSVQFSSDQFNSVQPSQDQCGQVQFSSTQFSLEQFITIQSHAAVTVPSRKDRWGNSGHNTSHYSGHSTVQWPQQSTLATVQYNSGHSRVHWPQQSTLATGGNVWSDKSDCQGVVCSQRWTPTVFITSTSAPYVGIDNLAYLLWCSQQINHSILNRTFWCFSCIIAKVPWTAI